MNSARSETGCVRQKRTKTVLLLLSVIALLVPSAFAQLDPNSPSTQWVPILYGNGNYPDPTDDQQTGSAEGDLVGNSSQPSLYMQYNSGYLGFRLRTGADANPPGYKGAAFIGLDANLNGVIDLFLGVDNHGSSSSLGIWYPGTGLNTSPSTTTIANTAYKTYAETLLNYSFAPVTGANDPGGASYDLNGDGKTDQFLTFYIPFADVASALATKGILFSTNSPMTLVAATATQPNSLNQDLNGVNGGINSSLTWSQLGAASLTYTPTGIAPVPEPSTLAIAGVAGVTLALPHFVRTRRRN